jgi:hypothetical protein
MPVFTAVRVTVAGIIPAALLLAACGSSSSGAAGASRPAVPAVPAADICVQVADVLGNGPDPDFDPVGYAEAQIRPLGDVHPAKPELQRALKTLASAYQREFTNGVTKQTKAAVRSGSHSVNTFCPGAAS